MKLTLRWKELIESSCTSWSIVVDYRENGSKVAFFLSTNRVFDKIKMLCLNKLTIGKAVDTLKKHGSKLKCLIVQDAFFDKPCHFLDILKLLPNLTELILYRAHTYYNDEPSRRKWQIDKLQVTDLPKLKTLQLCKSNNCFLNGLTKSTLSAIKIVGPYLRYREPMVNFLRSQSLLKTFTMISNSEEFLDEYMPFELTHLSLDVHCDYDQLLRFMKTQTKSIKALALGHFIPELFYKFVLEKCENLKSLRIMLYNLPKKSAFYEQLEKNISVNNLILADASKKIEHTPWLHQLIQYMSNITELTLLAYTGKENIQFIANTVKKLKKLTVFTYEGYVFAGSKFLNLHSLSIKCFNGGLMWDQFTKDNSHIKELVIHEMGESESFEVNNFFKCTMENLQLHTLRIGKNFNVDKDFFDIMRKFSLDIKIIDLPTCCCVLSEIHYISALQIHFEDNFIFCSNDLDFRFNYLWKNDEQIYR